MYPALVEKPAASMPLRRFGAPAPTERRFGFDAFWDMQLQLVHDPFTSGAVVRFVEYPYAAPALDRYPQYAAMIGTATTAARGALVVDAGVLFANSYYGGGASTPLRASLRHVWTDLAESYYCSKWLSHIEMIAAPLATAKSPSFQPPPLPLPPLSLPTAALAVELPRAIEVTTPYAEILCDLKRISPWHSWKKLAPLLSTSHTQLRRIASGEVVVPGDDLARNIGELHLFVQRLSRLAKNDATATTRLLTTPRERDGLSAKDFLCRQDYRNAFRATMHAASPNPQLAPVELVPRRWHDEPSIDIHDTEVEPEN